MADDGDRVGVSKDQSEIELEKINDEIKNLEGVQKDGEVPVNPAEPEQKPTQTDHLNKKLLSAFLDRLNSVDNSVAFGLQSATQRQCSEPAESHEKDFDNWLKKSMVFEPKNVKLIGNTEDQIPKPLNYFLVTFEHLWLKRISTETNRNVTAAIWKTPLRRWHPIWMIFHRDSIKIKHPKKMTGLIVQ